VLSFLSGGDALTASAAVQELSVIAFVALAIYGGCRDVASFTIPNWISLGIVAAFVVAVVAGQIAPAQVPGHVGAAVVVFAVGLALFHFRVFGGGDVKLMSAAALWTGFGGLADLVLMVACFGGVLTLALLAGRALPTRFTSGHAVLERLVSGRHGVPYGLAIAAGVLTAFIVLPLVAGQAIS
jgi:prepilin peptidase CpaA